MNILFISPSINPFDKNGYGSVQRTNLLLEACAKCGHVDVITFVDDVKSNIENCSVKYSQHLQTRVSNSRLLSTLRLLNPWYVYSVFPKHSEAASIVKMIVDNCHYDYIVVRYIPEAMKCGLLEYAEKLIIDVDDSPLEVARNASKTARRFRKRVYHFIQAAEMNVALGKLSRKVKYEFFPNSDQAVNVNSVYLPNIPYYEHKGIKPVSFAGTKPVILFFGNMNFGPNADGVDKFVHEVFPKIKEKVKDAEFHICGSCNNESLISKWSGVNGVKVLGFVPDIFDEYKEARVVVVPIYSGAGTNIKVLEAIQMMRPLVSTPCGMWGFSKDFESDVDCYVAEDADMFSKYTIELLMNETLNNKMACNAIVKLNSKYTKENFNRIVKEVFI